MKMTIDQYIDAEPVQGILGKYRFINEDICLGVVNENAKLIDYIVEAHLQDVKKHLGKERFYAVVDIRHLMWANKEFVDLINNGLFEGSIAACVILAETEFSRTLGESWLKGEDRQGGMTICDDLDTAISWINRKKALERSTDFGMTA